MKDIFLFYFFFPSYPNFQIHIPVNLKIKKLWPKDCLLQSAVLYLGSLIQWLFTAPPDHNDWTHVLGNYQNPRSVFNVVFGLFYLIIGAFGVYRVIGHVCLFVCLLEPHAALVKSSLLVWMYVVLHFSQKRLCLRS